MRRRTPAWWLLSLGALFLVGGQARAEEDTRVELLMRRVPLGVAVEALYRGTGVSVSVAPEVAQRLVSVNVRGVPRSVALRMLARAAGSPPVAVALAGGGLRLSQAPAPPVVPPVSSRQIASPARALNGGPRYLGGTGVTGTSGSRSGGSVRGAASGVSTGFFVTATVLPEPGDDGGQSHHRDTETQRRR